MKNLNEDQNKLIEEKIGRELTFDEQVDKQINKIVHESSAKKLIRKFKKRYFN